MDGRESRASGHPREGLECLIFAALRGDTTDAPAQAEKAAEPEALDDIDALAEGEDAADGGNGAGEGEP